MLAVASNAVRAEMGLKFISNIGVLINEIETAPAARRGELRDVLMEEVAAAQHVIQLMGAEGGQSPERLAETIRAALGPGDAMLIRRRGGDRAR